VALREQRAQLAGIHLLDVDSGEYNVPFVKHVLPEEPIILLHLAQREQGLMVAAGNPCGVGGRSEQLERFAPSILLIVRYEFVNKPVIADSGVRKLNEIKGQILTKR
jgi:putative molybdopterin biosynthesis protein